MLVFLSHKQEDSHLAVAVAQGLKRRGVGYYLDVFDPGSGSAADLTQHIRGCLAACDHLIAVVSRNTQLSWWVPWEIGVASERDYPLATFTGDRTRLPEYLEKWPVLSSDDDVGKYVETHRAISQPTFLTDSRVRTASVHDYANRFHAHLRRQLGQR